MKKVCLVVCLFIGSLYAKGYSKGDSGPLSPVNFQNPLEKTKGQSREKIEDLKINKFYLNMDAQKLKEVQQKDKKNKHALDMFDRVKINQKPAIRSISSHKAISMHPYYITTVLLPLGSKITSAQGKRFKNINFIENVMTIEVNNDFDRGNIVVLYAHNKQNKYLNIMVNRFDLAEIKRDVLDLTYVYRDIQEYTDLEIIQKYQEVYGVLPSKKYSYLYVGDIAYRIVKDVQHGNIFIKGNKYRVDNGIVYK
jgi:hypothetical protein